MKRLEVIATITGLNKLECLSLGHNDTLIVVVSITTHSKKGIITAAKFTYLLFTSAFIS